MSVAEQYEADLKPGERAEALLTVSPLEHREEREDWEDRKK